MTNTWLPVAEHVKARGACGAVILLASVAVGPALAAPSGGTVTSGSGSIGQNGATTTVTQTSSKLAIDWTSFGIQAGETVNFLQPGAGSIALNRVTGREASSILGSLNANGTVFILNPNGVLFGNGAQVNVGGLVASTLSLSNADFEAGRYAFSGSSTAGVTNQGRITVPSGGKVALIANSVDNTGTINAPQGSVLLAGAGNVTLTLAEGSPLGYTISQGAARTLVNNGGMIVADGGRVVLTARGLDSLSESVVNTTGVVRARTVANHQGTIDLLGDPVAGTTQVSGQIDASAPEAGGTGGTVKVLGAKVGVFDGARVDASGMAGGGTVLIGGNARGAGPEPNATAAYVAPTATIDASAVQRGDGGKLVVWGTDVANVHGALLANGGAQGGNGGSIETSGHALDTDGIAVSVAGGGGNGGSGGLWRLDPYNVTISTGTQTGGSFTNNVWTPSANGSLVKTTSIQNILNTGGSVTITTAGAGAQEGNIALNGSISKTAGGNASLTLIADGRITTNASSGTHRTITSTSGALNVSMTAHATTSAASNSGINLRYVDISANGGNISATASGAQSSIVPALDLENSTWSTTGTGSISLSGTVPANGSSQGVYLSANTLTTASGAITVSGTSGGIATISGYNSSGAPLFSSSNIGVYLAGGNTLHSTGGGAITLTGTATGATDTWAGSGVTLSALDALSTTGAVSITGTASNPVSSTYRNQLSTVDIAGSSSSAASLTGGTVSITGTNSTVGGASSTSNSAAAVKLEGKVNITATAGPINISGSNAGGDGVWGSGSGAVTMSAPAASSINISALSLDTVSGYTGFYIGGSSTLTFATAAPVGITAQSLVSTRRALWNKGGLIAPGNLSIVATGGAVADDTTHGGYFHVTGTTSINSNGAGNTVSLTNSGNAFNGAVSVTASDTTLANSAALTLGTSTVSGALSVTAAGISQSGAVSVSGTTTLNGGTSAITLANSGNAFSGAVSLTGSNATLTDGTALTLGTSTLSGNLNATAAGITQSGAVSVAGTATLNGGTSAITLTNSGNAFGGAVALTGSSATLTNSTAVSLGASTLSGNLKVTASGITQSGALSVGGISTLNSGSSAITLANSGNVFGGAVALTGSNATLVDGTALALKTSTLSGNLNLTAPGITQSGAVSVAGTTTLNSGSSAITLANSGNAFNGAVLLTGSNATLTDSTALTLGASTLSGNLNATASGITQSGVVSVAGTTMLNSGSSAITLANSGNTFGGAVSLTGSNATLTDSTALTLGASTLSGNLNATAPGITQSGAVSVAGTTTLNSGTSAITLANSGNAFGGAVSLTGSNATLADSTALTFGASTLSGSLNATAAGITQTGAVSVAGATTLDGGSAAIALTNGGNTFNTLAVTGAAGVNVVNADALSVTGVSSTGTVRLTTMSGNLATRGNWSISGGDLTLSAGAGTARGTAGGGDVDSQATLAIDAGRTVTVYSGAVASTVLGGSLAARAAAGSGNFRYNRQDGDAPGANGVGDGATYVMYRERPTVTITPTDAANTKVYGGDNAIDPALAYTISGQVNGDSAAQILTGSLARTAGQNAGRYAITQGTLADRLGYQTALDAGHTFSITPAPLVVTANNASRAVGQDNPAFSATFVGLVGGQTALTAGLQGTLGFFTSANAASPVGSYTVLPGGLLSGNYSIRYVAGTLTVLPASLPPYMSAVIDLQIKARAAGAALAPEAAQPSGLGWRTTTTAFNPGNPAVENMPGNLLAAEAE